MNISAKWVSSLPSTHTALTEHPQEWPPLTLVIAREQTAGRGQRGNTWEATPGDNLTFSMILPEPPVKPASQFAISEAFALAIADVLDEYLDIVAYRMDLDSDELYCTVKWPNDIYVGDRKICGILIQHSVTGDSISQSVLSAGINLNQEKFLSDAPNPVSVIQLTGYITDIQEVVFMLQEKLAGRLKQLDDEEGRADLHNAYMWRLYRADGNFYRFRDNIRQEEITARIIDVAPDGVITLATDSDDTRRYYFKEMTFLI